MLNLLQSYQAANAFLDSWYFRNYNDALGSYLGDMRLMKHQDNWQTNPISCDAKAWEDWQQAASQVLQHPANLSDFVTASDNFEILKHFLQIYLSLVRSTEMQQLCADLQKIDPESAWWKLWLICMHRAKNNSLFPAYDSLISSSFMTVSQHQAISIMSHFLHHYPENQIEAIHVSTQLEKLLLDTNQKNNVIQTALKSSCNQVLSNHSSDPTMLELFKIFYMFINKYADQYNLKNLKKLVLEWSYYDNGQPEKYEIYYQWQKAFHEVLYPL